MNHGVKDMLLQRLLGIRLNNIVRKWYQKISKEIGAFSRDLSGHVVDTAHQHSRSIKAVRVFVSICIVEAKWGIYGGAFVHKLYGSAGIC